MRIYRAYSYFSMELIREEEKKLPIHIITLLRPYQLIVLPQSIPLWWIGIEAWNDRADEKKFVGWCDYPQNTKLPHIFILEGFEKWGFFHEVGHAVDERLGFPSKNLFKPKLALTDYGKTNHHEYFAETFKEFFNPVEKENLFKADRNIFSYIRTIVNG